MFYSTDKVFISVAVAVFFLYYCVIILLPGSSLLQDADTYWHIRTGQWILDHRQFPVVDFYSYTATGTRWIAVEWLSDIFFALAFNIGGWRGVVILSALTIAAIITILCFYLLRNLRLSVAIGCTAITSVALSPHYLARPHIFSYIILSVWVIALLETYDREEFKPPTLLLCALMVVWANLHPSFTLGLALLYVVTSYSSYEKIMRRDYVWCRNAVLMLAAVSVCALLTPYGIYSALLTLETVNLKFTLQHITEWKSPDFQIYRIHLFLVVGIMAAIGGLGIRLRGPRLILFSIMMLLGLSHIRGLIIFFLTAPILLARPLLGHSTWWHAAQHADSQSTETIGASDPVIRYFQKRSVAIPAICLVLAAFVTAYSWREINIGPRSDITPKAAIEFVRSAGITGNVFNNYGFGGYLIFSGIPTFIDSRVPPYTDSFVQKFMEAEDLVDIDESFALLDKYNVSWVILRPMQPLAKALPRSLRWAEAYSDKDSVVFVRR